MVRFTRRLLHLTTALLGPAKSGGDTAGIVRVAVVGAAVRVDKAEIGAVVGIDGPAKSINRRQTAALPRGKLSEIHPIFLFSFPVAFHDVPQQGFLLVDQFPDGIVGSSRPWYSLQSWVSEKHPCGFLYMIM